MYALRELEPRPQMTWEGRALLGLAWAAFWLLGVLILGVVAALGYGLFLLAQAAVRGAGW
jgi:hypothetical protein